MADAHVAELGLITSFLGVPAYILTTFFPILQQLASRQPKLVKGICLLAALSTFGLSLLDRLKHTLLTFFVSNFMFTTTIDARDPLFVYVSRWLRDKRKFLPEQKLQARSRDEFVRTQRRIGGGVIAPTTHRADPNSPSADVIYDFDGVQVFWHKWRPYFVSPWPRGRAGDPSFLILRSFGLSSEPLREIVNEAYKVHRSHDQAFTTGVYRPVDSARGWRCVARRARRSLDTVVMDSDDKANLLEDVKFYLSKEAQEWYSTRGIPYRRGYLFHGKPGTGKTSLSMAIAGQFGLEVYIVSLQDPHIDDTFLYTFFSRLPKGALILLEDIDSAGLTREAAHDSRQSYRERHARGWRASRPTTNVTLAGLLNAIDGADSPEGHLLIMTTNVPDALDEALVRPGRIDYKIGFRASTSAQAKSIFLRMYAGDAEDGDTLERLATEFATQIPEETFTPAELQGFLMRHKKLPKEALAVFADWVSSVLQERAELEKLRSEAEAQRKNDEDERKARGPRTRVKNRARFRKGGVRDTASRSDSSESSEETQSTSSTGSEFLPNLSQPGYVRRLNGDPTDAVRDSDGQSFAGDVRPSYARRYSSSDANSIYQDFLQ